jgi:hypothetical protein
MLWLCRATNAGADAMNPCDRCAGTGWVCEDDPSKPLGSFSSRADACKCDPRCGGQPCPDCNSDGQPRMPATVEITADKDGWDTDDEASEETTGRLSTPQTPIAA